MKIAGIVAEYNPLHRGHLYHIRKTRECAQIDAIIAVISSNFVQRGEPALLDKGARAAMALASGADLVLELPVVYSSHNAGLFANAAVDILAATGLVGTLSYGMETPDDRISAAADLLNDEPASFQRALRGFLEVGYSFVEARSMALDELIPGTLDLLRRPNNNLALAYVKRIRERGYPMESLPVERMGAGYHDRAVGPGDEFASATAIRELLASGERERAFRLMPAPAAQILKDALDAGHVSICRDRLWRSVKQALLRADEAEISQIAEMREGLHNRMMRAALRAPSLESFVAACVSKRYPKGRVQRYCMHLLMGLAHADSRAFQEHGPAYIRVLGANETGRRLLGAMRKSARLPVIAKSSARMNNYAGLMMRFEHRATELWELLTEAPRLRAEARFVPLMPEGSPPHAAG